MLMSVAAVSFSLFFIIAFISIEIAFLCYTEGDLLNDYPFFDDLSAITNSMAALMILSALLFDIYKWRVFLINEGEHNSSQ